jgi:hypothetical protein
MATPSPATALEHLRAAGIGEADAAAGHLSDFR